ncbi:hypothetical protein IQ249_05505 [Lusitaniella coriacea LEGE 07157]|uniref:Uncharacterized protein n=1 Tax=Lusitaniella coriacea LEGE 07157 TaxID=945747 RepID=A0A8J7B3U9_9CYAN|nr:hypothetical protein [Lusitaniella coriacea]MBE9115352.1 hypothetical protein [Lusitaniella coriacea LEGE 07157]
MSFEKDHQQCLEKLVWATHELQVDIDRVKLSRIAELIVQTMTGPWRYFHTPEHIFEVGGTDNAIEVLAALFHDLVYVQVDKSVNFNLTYYISPFIRQIKEKLYIRDRHELPQDTMCEMVMEVFGFAPGRELSPFAGQNEFLSGLICAKVMEPFISSSLILQIVACIEATIPFRPPSKEGFSASEQLYMRLKEINSKYEIGMSVEELRLTVRRAVRMSNRDVGSFANPSSAQFLDGTWSLLPETNHNLQNTTSYTVHQYRVALQKMEGFMNFLRPDIIFQQFDGEPNDAAYQELLARSGRNIQIAKLYLGSKLFTIAVLETLSLRFGSDIPLSTMMGESGELSPDRFSIEKLENFLPAIDKPYTPQNDIENEVLNLLEVGRSKSSGYDIKNSPLTTFIIKFIGFDEIRTLLVQAKAFFQDEISGEEFLAQCNPEVKEIITNGLLRLFDRRKAALQKV